MTAVDAPAPERDAGPEMIPTTAQPVELRPALFRTGAVVLLIALALVALPAVLDAYWLSTATAGVVFILPVAGVGLLFGRLAIVSMCQMALVGVGGWCALRLSFATDLPFVANVLLSGAITALIGVVIGLPTLRLSGLYFALISLMAAGAAEVVFMSKGFPNGGSGFFGVKDATATPDAMGRPALATGDAAYFRYVVVATVALLAIVWLHRRARPGRAWATIRRGEASAQSLGVRVARYKLWAIVISAFLAGVGGALLAGQIGTLDASGFTASQSVVLFAVTLLGGAFSLFGWVLGGVTSQVIPAVLEKLSLNGNASLLLFGFGLVMTLATAPHGMAGQLADLARALARVARRPAARGPSA
jgi:ABC-type branched-subunit amino acid transport system permease subunit